MRRSLLAVVALATLLAGGCGIPDNTRVTVVGPGPSDGVGDAVDNDSVPLVPNDRKTATDPVQLVRFYLQAAAGDPGSALGRVKAFLSPDKRESFEAGTDVKVIRLKGSPLYTPGDPLITFNAQQIGTLKSDGSLEPSTDASVATTEYKLKVGTVAGQSGFFVTDAPHVLLLADTALDDFYARRTIYFWNNENTALIPDLRYMPRSLPTVQQPTTILSWLVSGPASWLGDAVHGLPSGTVAPDNVPAATNDTLTVTLSSQAVPAGDPKALDRLRRQLQWSLRQLDTRTLELKIGRADPVRYSTTDFRASNPADRLADVPERFVIYNGVVRRLADTPHQDEPVPVLKAADNKGISAAAISTSGSHDFAAVVATSGKTTKLRVAAAPVGAQAGLKDVGGLSGSIGRPVWAITDANDPAGAIGLITVNGKLYSFGTDGSPAEPVEWPGEPGPITAVSVAPDGYRVALVSGGRLYRTSLITGGAALTMSAPEQLLPPTFSTVSAVAWSSETYLAVAGEREDAPRYAVVDVSIDGALPYTRLQDIGKEAVTYLTAYPSNPVTRGENADSESYEAAGQAWDVLGEPVKITVGNLAGPAATPQPGKSPTAPFFLD